MGFRFRKSIKLLPGLRLNLSKSGVSASVGVKGATLNISERGTKGTVGLPGTGISYTEKIEPGRRLVTADGRGGIGRWVAMAVILGVALAWLFK